MKTTVKYLLNKLGWELSRVKKDIEIRQFLYESKKIKSKNSSAELFFLTDQKEKNIFRYSLPLQIKKMLESLSNFNKFLSFD